MTPFEYLKQDGLCRLPTIIDVDDAEGFHSTQQALSIVGISIENGGLFSGSCPVLLYLGNVKITRTRSDAVLAENDWGRTRERSA
jgi:myosin V